MQVGLLVEPSSDDFQISGGLGETDQSLRVGLGLALDGFGGSLGPGDRSFDHEHGLADLSEHPFPRRAIGVQSCGHLHGVESSRPDLVAEAPQQDTADRLGRLLQQPG